MAAPIKQAYPRTARADIHGHYCFVHGKGLPVSSRPPFAGRRAFEDGPLMHRHI